MFVQPKTGEIKTFIVSDDIWALANSGGSNNFQKGCGGGAEDDVTAPSSFIANAHNELYAFNLGKGGFLKKNSELLGRAATLSPPFESATACELVYVQL